MVSEGVAEVLAKDFIALKIDEDRMIGGQELHARLRGERSGGLPWSVFLDSDGTELAAANDTSREKAPNVGFPQTDAEVAWFGQMLQASRATITDEEIAQLQASLVKVREERKRAAEERKKRAAGG